ncbi:MAG TPA: hypothetical protein VHE54_15660 [Puia sp.]|nr:hypothetical protein [Puia sp.]
MKKFAGIFVGVLVAGFVVFVGIRYFSVFEDGYRAGTLNYVVRKGYIWKTYEGELIQTGIKSKTPGVIQSNQFDFSIDDPAIAQRLELASGKEVNLHYKRYFGTLPWRGYNKYIVDSIVSIEGK